LLAYPARWISKPDARSQPERVRLALEELGPTYIKLGQAISTRTDLVPAEYVAELSKLQDGAAPISYQQVKEVFLSEFGQPPEELFSQFDPTPKAAASIGQVHRARLMDGTHVVVKVQRPGAEEQVDEDLGVLKEVVHNLSGIRRLRNYDLEGWLDEFAFTLRNELDYLREGQNADRFRENFQDDRSLHVPVVYWQYTTKRILTMEEVSGIKMTDVEKLDERGIDRRLVASECARIVLAEIFEHGLFHADPHAGNFFVEPGIQINLIDFGMVGTLDRDTRESLLRITLAQSRREVDGVIDELLTIGFATQTLNRQALREELGRVLEQHLDSHASEFSLARIFSDTLRVAADNHIQVQSNLLFLARALAMCEGVGQVLDPTYQLMDTAREELERIYRESHSPEQLVERTRQNYVEMGDFALGLPKHTRRILQQVENGDLVITARLGDSSELLEHFHRAANRLSMAIIVAGVIAGLSVLSLRINHIAAAFWINLGLIVAIGGGIILFVAIWRSRRV
jgi:ubiquinone biosynthesis protein